MSDEEGRVRVAIVGSLAVVFVVLTAAALTCAAAIWR